MKAIFSIAKKKKKPGVSTPTALSGPPISTEEDTKRKTGVHWGPSAAYKDSSEIAEHFLGVVKEISEATDVLSPLKSACAVLLRGIHTMRTIRNNQMFWADLCEELERNLEQMEVHRDDLQSGPTVDNYDCLRALENYISIIAKIIDTALKHSAAENRRIISRIGRSGTVDVEKEDIRRSREMLEIAWQSYSLSMKSLLKLKVGTIEDLMREQEVAHVRGVSIRRAQDDYGVMGSDYAVAYGERLEVCEQGTRVKILDEIRKWADNTETSKQIFWLSDAAGTGKSTVAATMAKEWSLGGQLAGRFFFSPNSTTTQTTKGFCLAVARDIVTNQPMLAEVILDVINTTPLDQPSSFETQIQQLIVNPLRNHKANKCLLLAVDALDNCVLEEERSGLLNGLIKYLPSVRYLRVLLTTRPYQDIVDILESSPLVQSTDTQLLNIRHSYHHDINIYVEKRLGNISTISSDQRKMIVAMSGGLFLFAATVCRMLERCRHPNDIVKILSNIGVTERLERKMDILYLAALNRALVDRSANKLMMNVLSLIIIAYQPLSINTLRRFLSDSVHVEDFVQDLSSVLKDGNPDRPIKVLHPTFREFVLSNEDRANGFLINPITSSTVMAIACIDTLEHFLHEDMLQLTDGVQKPVLNSDVVGIAHLVDTHTTAAERYASAFWAHHVAASEVDQQLLSRVTQFLLHKFLNWVELMSWRSSLGICIEGLSRLQAVLSKGKIDRLVDPNPAHSQIIHHARHFVLRHQSFLMDSALQTYCMALFFTPIQSPLFGGYRRRYSQWQPEITTSYVSEWDGDTSVGKHSGSVYNLLFSPAGTHVISVGSDGLLQLWHGETGALVGKPFQGWPSRLVSSITNCTFSADGTRFSFLSSRRELHIRFSQTNEAIIPPVEGYLKYAFTPGMTHMLSVVGSTVQLSNIDRGSETSPARHIGTLPDGFKAQNIAISPKIQMIVCVGEFQPSTGTADIFLWELATFKQISNHRLNTMYTSLSFVYVAFSPDSTRFVTWAENRQLQLFNGQTGDEILQATQEKEYHPYRGLATFCPLSRHFAYTLKGSADVTIRSVETGDTVSILSPDRSGIICISFSIDGQQIGIISEDRLFRAWDFQTKGLVQKITLGYPDVIISGALSPDWSRVAIASEDKQIHLSNLHEGALENSSVEGQKPRKYSIIGASFVNSLLAIREDSSVIHLWDAATGETHSRITTVAYVSHLAFSPDGKMIAALLRPFGKSLIRVWDAGTLTVMGKDLYGIIHVDVDTGGIFFSSNSRLLVVHHEGGARILDLETGETIWSHLMGKSGDSFELINISPNNMKVACRNKDCRLSVWNLDAPSQAPLVSTIICSGTIGAFSPTDPFLLAIVDPLYCQFDLWRVNEDTQLISRIKLPEHAAGKIVFSLDGQYLAYGQYCWDVLMDPSTLTPYHSLSPPTSFERRGLNTHSFLSYKDGWIYSSYPPGPVLPIPTELRVTHLADKWHVSDEIVILLSRRGTPILINCAATLARARAQEK